MHLAEVNAVPESFNCAWSELKWSKIKRTNISKNLLKSKINIYLEKFSALLIAVLSKYLRSQFYCGIIFNLNPFNLSLFRYNHKHEQLENKYT